MLSVVLQPRRAESQGIASMTTKAASKSGIVSAIRREVQLIAGLRRTLKAYGTLSPSSPDTVGDEIERSVDRFSSREAFRFEGRSMTYAEFDALANRFARWALAQGLKRGDRVALFMGNCPEYVAFWVGMTKAGIATALINSHLAGNPLAHCISIAEARHVVTTPEFADAVESARGLLGPDRVWWSLGGSFPGANHLDPVLAEQGSERLPAGHRAGMTAGDLALYVYTSGTTGAPKAARMPHWRVLGMLRGFIGGVQAKETDRVYLCLPLYHSTGGLCGVGTALERGGCVILRRKFSASHFWPEVVAERATIFVYIGELCRYLVNAPENPLERQHQLRAAFGNGMRPEVWERFNARFGVGYVQEFYGATEGNVTLMNFDGRIGAIGRIPDYLRKRFNVRIIKFDLEQERPHRGADGLCIEAGPDEAGEVLGEIRAAETRFRYEGYSGDPAQTEKKILRDVFVKGDAWFRTGDLMRRDRQGYFYFVDRIGDTFRWKSENVSTNEVGEVLASFPGVLEANVYGVRVADFDGRAGMAVIVAEQDVPLDGLKRHVDAQLPPYARPLFLRMRREMETTGTFKYRKMELVAEGFDPAVIAEPILFDHPATGGYVRLDPGLYAEIQAGTLRL